MTTAERGGGAAFPAAALARRAGELPSDLEEEPHALVVAGEQTCPQDLEGQEFQFRDQLIAVGNEIAVRHLFTSLLQTAGWGSRQ